MAGQAAETCADLQWSSHRTALLVAVQPILPPVGAVVCTCTISRGEIGSKFRDPCVSSSISSSSSPSRSDPCLLTSPSAHAGRALFTLRGAFSSSASAAALKASGAAPSLALRQGGAWLMPRGAPPPRVTRSARSARERRARSVLEMVPSLLLLSSTRRSAGSSLPSAGSLPPLPPRDPPRAADSCVKCLLVAKPGDGCAAGQAGSPKTLKPAAGLDEECEGRNISRGMPLLPWLSAAHEKLAGFS
eukprot:2540099-Rhodomonas_salina.1